MAISEATLLSGTVMHCEDLDSLAGHELYSTLFASPAGVWITVSKALGDTCKHSNALQTRSEEVQQRGSKGMLGRADVIAPSHTEALPLPLDDKHKLSAS